MRSHRIARAATWVAGPVAGLVLLAATPLPSWLAASWAVRGQAQSADAIVVLGGGVVWPGELTCRGLRRLQHAVRLYHEGWAPWLVVSGGRSPRAPEMPPEAVFMELVARDLGVPPDRILVERKSTRTRDQGVEVAALLRERGWSTVVLVTDPLHMRRARAVFRAQGLRVFPASSFSETVVARTPGEGLVAFEELAYEVAATLYYRVRGWV